MTHRVKEIVIKHQTEGVDAQCTPVPETEPVQSWDTDLVTDRGPSSSPS